MPVYNGARYIREALDSLLMQTFTDFELIISDNGSVDETEKICLEFSRRDSRVRYIRHNKNRGPTENFQFVLDQAVGQYFMWAAADDRRDPSCLERSMEVMLADDACGLVFSDYHVLNIDTGALSKAEVGMFNSPSPLKNYVMRLLAPCSSIIYGLHRVALLRKIPIINYDYFDIHLTHWYAIHSNIKIIPLPLYVAGIKGKLTDKGGRIPYSVTGTQVDPTAFFRDEYKMLSETFSLPKALVLYALLRYFYGKSHQ
jgi:glycosyltransferase involved in cell wall biosynthesis